MTSLADFMTYCRQRSAMEDDNAIDDIELQNMCNNALAQLYGLLVRTYEDYFSATYMVTLAGTQYQIPTAPDILKIRAVDYNEQFNAPENLWYTINQYQLPERNQFNNPMSTITQPWGKVSLAWRLMQDTITISPQNQCQGVYRVWYIPKWANLVNLTDPIPANVDQQGWTELAVALVCVRICNKLRLDSAMFNQEVMELTQRIKSEAKNRQAAGGKRIANVRYNNSDQLLPFNFFGD